MNLNSIKKFAQEMRRDFIAQVGARLDFVLSHDDEFLRAHDQEKRKIIELVETKGREALVDEAAYLWFNRLAAFCYMDARGYTSPRVLSPRPGESQPELLSEIKAGRAPRELKPLASRFEALLSGRIRSLQPDREVYKDALLATCNAWASAMPWLFAKVEDWAGLLLPQDILSPDSLVARMVAGLTEEDCAQGVEIIGWLYQFYISEKKDEVFAALKKNVKISKENIPAATQLFTPHWIVRFMVENSLGRLWLLNHPESRLKERMKYFVESDPEPDYLKVKDPTEIKCLDPCCGSGHILAYFFELLYAIYEEEGYAPQEIPSLIVKHNIFGIDIDERAAELAAFTLAMVAREKDKRFFDRGIIPNVIAMRDVDIDLRKLSVRLSPALQESLELLKEGRNYGSLISVPRGAGEEIDEVEAALQSHRYDDLFGSAERDDLGIAFRILKYLEPHYHVVVTNPPYMGSKGMNERLKEYLEKYYPEGKVDLFAAFIERNLQFIIRKAYVANVTMQSWMFLSSFEALRKRIIEEKTIISMVHMDNMVMRIAFGTAAVVLKNSIISDSGYRAQYSYVELTDINEDGPKQFPIRNARYTRANQRDFQKIPGSPIAYWITDNELSAFSNSYRLKEIGDTRQGLATNDNDRFLRFWAEVDYKSIKLNAINRSEAKKSLKKWFPYNKGGRFLKWYGNTDYIINWYNDGEEIIYLATRLYGSPTRTVKSISEYFKNCVSWSKVSSGNIAIRYYKKGSIFDVAGCCIFSENNDSLLLIIALINSKVIRTLLKILSPTLNFEAGQIASIPIKNTITEITKNNPNVKQCISISKLGWDLLETSWDFKQSPLLADYSATRIETIVDDNLTDWSWPAVIKPGTVIDLSAQVAYFKSHWTKLFIELHRNEEENNRIFIELYGLQDELTPEVPYSEITILQEELVESARKENRIEFDESVLARQFVSYGIGCLMGRYSVDKDDLILADAGATLDDFKVKVPNARFLPDEDAILPLTDEDDFSDDLPTRFKAWLRVISVKYFEDNLRWIEDRLGKDLRSYFIRDFYKDHLRRYKNRPIYWMISSPSGSFRTLMYLHRYTKDTVGKVLNDYLRPYRNKTEQKLRGLQGIMDSSSASQSEKVKAKKRAAQLEKISAELDLWEKDVVYPTALARIELDLDDGVKVNYRKLSTILESVKQLEAKDEE